MTTTHNLDSVTTCPKCGAPHEWPTHTDDGEALRPPIPGDLSVCFGCKAFLRFDESRRLVALSDDEFETLKPIYQEALRKVFAQITAKGVS